MKKIELVKIFLILLLRCYNILKIRIKSHFNNKRIYNFINISADAMPLLLKKHQSCKKKWRKNLNNLTNVCSTGFHKMFGVQFLTFLSMFRFKLDKEQQMAKTIIFETFNSNSTFLFSAPKTGMEGIWP